MASFSGLRSSIVFVFLCVAMHVAYGTHENRPVLFIFGDSTADVGTNNFLNTRARANVPYYGIDYPNSVPTGRFSNGFNTVDYIAKLFGYVESPPPYLALLNDGRYTFKRDVIGGVNFASGGSGILRDTGKKQWGEVISLERQVLQFEAVRASLSKILGEKEAATFVSQALFIISIGGNDLLEFSRNDTAVRLGQKHYLSALQSNYYTCIRSLYALGARKFGIISVAAIGCCPAVKTMNYGGECVASLNQFASVFNSATASVLQRLSYELKDFKYSLGNSLAMTSAVLERPLIFGIKETKKACCGEGKLNGEGPCLKANNAELCGNRNDFLFWDWFHPTDKASWFAASTLYSGGSDFVTPINFRQLALMY
ncbi:GDSL esterase/lipase At5g33370-like [Prosopis cineraria]|uniref:GDSL esterase/lipase At5g33370-like n=1 Tax=Prosopis cineraria TaxID=364024 RepID=UPI00240FEABF|nr:GDSL esterase/lipase At5g33370-like [Prosopis cineraria]